MTGSMGLPLIRMDSDDHFRFMIAVMFSVPSIFLMTATFPAASMARKNAAGSREQGDNAY
jgi:hypothetical protein